VTDQPPICPCGRTTELRDGAHVYGRPDLAFKHFWCCEPCDMRVGCHPGTTTPLGQLAGPKVRALRMEAHALLDPLWKTAEKWYTSPPLPASRIKSIRSIARRRVYRWLALQLGATTEEIHIAGSDEATCRAIIQALQNVDYGRIRKEVH